MKNLANTTVSSFGYDQTNTVKYRFNHLGFRNDYNVGTSINVIGNSVSFGIGLDEQQTFGHILSQKLKLPCNNFSFGCYLHENHDHLNNLNILSQRNTDDIFIIQINNLNRRRDGNNVVLDSDPTIIRNRFFDYFDNLRTLIAGRRTMLIYWDNQDYSLPKSVTDKLSIFNKFCLDCAINNKNTFGPLSHLAIAKTLAALYLAQFN
jgi:hypothetical protein